MVDHGIRVAIIPWDEPAFHAAVQDACRLAHRQCPEPPSAAGEMDLAQHFLRCQGFPRATVTDARSVDEFVRHIDHWIVRRDGAPPE